MVKELKVRIDRSQIVPAPINHCLMDIDSHIAAWPRILLKELPCNTSASTTEVKHCGVGIQDHAGDDGTPLGLSK